MAKGDDNVALRLLREIRSEQRDRTRDLTALKREVGELKEGMTTALGLAATSTVRGDHAGERLDEITDEIAAIKRRRAASEGER